MNQIVQSNNFLEKELESLKNKFHTCYELKVRWIPNGSEKLSGEVKGEIIFIYDKEEEFALETLKHEFLDYAISKVIEPYKNVINKLIQLINEESYKKKEKLINALSNFS